MSQNLAYLKRPAKAGISKPEPIFLIHGYGSDENDLFAFASSFPEQYFIISIRAPYPMQPYGNAWYAINFDAEKGKWSNIEQAVSSRDLLHHFIQERCAHYNLNTANSTLFGFSQGSILAFALALTHPSFYKNIVGMSGYINTDLYKVKPNIEAYSHLAVFASHGTQDQVIPIEWALKTPSVLNALGIQNTFKSYPIGHGVSPQNFSDILHWLKANSRDL